MSIVEWDEYVGRLAPLETVEVRARVSGYLATTNFDEGQIVNAGDLLAVIDQRPFQAEVHRTEANLSAAKAMLGQSQSAAAQAEAEKKNAVIREALAQKRLRRSDQLRQQNATTIEDFDVRSSEFEQAQADVVVADAGIDAAKAAIVAAQAAVGVAQANLDLAKLNLQYTEVRSPITGRISRRYVTEGNLVSGGTNDSTLLTTIVSVDPIHCYFDADEAAFLKYVRLAREGARPSSRDVRNPVYVALANEEGGFPHLGHMDFVENRLDEETNTIRGRAILPNKNLDLTPGLFARVRIPGSPAYEAVLIPDRAIGTDQAEKFVYVVDDQNKVARTGVTLGSISHGLRVIRSGLTGSEKVVLSGLQRIRPGAEVDVEMDTIVPGKESLPDEYHPVPEDQWLIPKRKMAANVWVPESAAPPSRKAASDPIEEPRPEPAQEATP
jgi:RND family efflux transporter MFP subunit